MKLLKLIDSIRGIPRFLLILSSLVASGILIYAVTSFVSGGLYNILFSQSLFSTGVTVFAEGLAFGLFGDALIKRAGGR